MAGATIDSRDIDGRELPPVGRIYMTGMGGIISQGKTKSIGGYLGNEGSMTREPGRVWAGSWAASQARS